MLFKVLKSTSEFKVDKSSDFIKRFIVDSPAGVSTPLNSYPLERVSHGDKKTDWNKYQ